MRRLWIGVLPAAAILLLTAPGAFASGAENGNGHGQQSTEGSPGRSPQHPNASPSRKTPPQRENISNTSDPWGFMAPLIPAVRAIGDMFKPIISASGLEEELGDIMAALNETSRNPLFLFGLEGSSQGTPSAKTHPKSHGAVQRQQANGSRSPQTKPQPSQDKQKDSSLLPLEGLFRPGRRASETPPGPQDGVPPRKTPEKEHSGHSEEEEGDSALWRVWDKEDLELL